MLETFVSSRIRRTLLEYLLTHPDQRFYLRGLAKELLLPVSPLRRELKRMEQLGLLKAYDEAHIRFYVVDQASPQFAELRKLASAAPETAPVEATQPLVASTVISHPKTERIRKALKPAVNWPLTLGVGGLVLAVCAAIVAASYLASRPQVTVVQSPPPASGEMHSARWRLMPGAVGGFSSGAGASQDSY